ncbi:hypothetical protein ACI0Y6_004066, partial [Cronobacter turicensis]
SERIFMTDKSESITNEQKEEEAVLGNSKEESKDKDEKKDSEIPNAVKNLIGLMFMLAGAATYGWNMYDFPVKDFFQEYGDAVVGVVIMIIGCVIFIFSSIIPYLRTKSLNDFAEVDREYATNKDEIKSKASSENLHIILKRIESKLDTNSAQPNNNQEINLNLEKISVDLVKSTLTQTINTLENKADAADKKASILLQRGVNLTKFGIVYYLLSIIIWQIIFFKSPYKPEHVYGILSCSFLFLFIEFLSAWFLKQYKNFTDNSVYLLKIKSIFDRFLIVYLIDENQNEFKNPDNINFKTSLDLLSKDFAWPDTSVIESKEQTFARETISSLTELINAIKIKEKESPEK